MRDLKVAIIIPFRDRGVDPLRATNLEVVTTWWSAQGYAPTVVSDGNSGDAQFNRHRAYNRGVAENPNADVFVFAEADMLLPKPQIEKAIRGAMERQGIVVPFTEYRYMSEKVSDYITRLFNPSVGLKPVDLSEWINLPPNAVDSVYHMRAESTMKDGRSIGAVNVVSRRTLNTVGGFTEATSGNWYDDNITEESFAFLTHLTRFIIGPAVHLYHKPGWKGEHLTDKDRAATERNKSILKAVRAEIDRGNPAGVRRVLGLDS